MKPFGEMVLSSFSGSVWERGQTATMAERLAAEEAVKEAERQLAK